MSFTLSASDITDTSASIILGITSTYSEDEEVNLTVQVDDSGGATVDAALVTIESGAVSGDSVSQEFTGLTEETTYYVSATVNGGPIIDDVTFTTKATGFDTARSATQEQWEDLIDKVQSKAEIGTVLSTPSNVAYIDTDNIVDQAVSTAKITDGAVTTAKIANEAVTGGKIDFSTFTFYASENFGGNRSTNSTSYQDLSGTYSIPEDGLYFVTTQVTSGNGGSTKFDMKAKILCNGADITRAIETNSYLNRASNNFAALILVSVFFAHKNDIVKVQTNMTNATVASYHNAKIQRIF